jgi:hypothetical protein
LKYAHEGAKHLRGHIVVNGSVLLVVDALVASKDLVKEVVDLVLILLPRLEIESLRVVHSLGLCRGSWISFLSKLALGMLRATLPLSWRVTFVLLERHVAKKNTNIFLRN